MVQQYTLSYSGPVWVWWFW